MSEAAPDPVVHSLELPAESTERGAFRWKRRRLGTAAGGERLGCSWYELPPGAKSFPYHWHCGNEEALYVLEGAGRLRLAGRELPLAAGDYVALRRGPGGAHQLRNDGAGPLRYLLFSTMAEPDISVYPDSGKVGLFAGSAPGGPPEARILEGFLRRDAALDYWADES